jgi:hypothetical protein
MPGSVVQGKGSPVVITTATTIPAATGIVSTTGVTAGSGTAAAAAAAAPPQLVEYPGNIVSVPATAFDSGD